MTFPPPLAPSIPSRTAPDAFIARFSADGSALLYSHLPGWSGYEWPVSIFFHWPQTGEAIVVGETQVKRFSHHARRLRPKLQRRVPVCVRHPPVNADGSA